MRPQVAAGASTVTSAAFQISLVAWPDFIRSHVQHHIWVASALWISSAALWVWWFAVRWGNGETAPSGNKTQQTRDVSGKMFQAETLNYHEAPEQVPVRKPSRHRKRANLIGLDPKNERLDEDFLRAKWLPVGVFPIENRIGRTMVARDICASIRFNGSTQNYVRRAYWSGKRGNVNEISIGDIQSLIIGQKIDDHWYYFDNPTAYPDTWGSVSYVKLPDPGRLVLPKEGITAVVTLFHPEEGNSLLTAKLLIGSDGTITRAR